MYVQWSSVQGIPTWAATWMDLEDIMLCEMSHQRTDVMAHTRVTQKRQLHAARHGSGRGQVEQL